MGGQAESPLKLLIYLDDFWIPFIRFFFYGFLIHLRIGITRFLSIQLSEMQTAFIHGYSYNYKESGNRFPAIIDESGRQP